MSGYSLRSLWLSLSERFGSLLNTSLACLLTTILLLAFLALVLVDFSMWVLGECMSSMKIKCKAISARARLKSIAYECVPIVTILIIAMPMAVINGHNAVHAWLGLCASWSVIHFIIKLSSYPYKQSNGQCGVNHNLESDAQKHQKGRRVLHIAVETLSIYAVFTIIPWSIWALAAYLIGPYL